LLSSQKAIDPYISKILERNKKDEERSRKAMVFNHNDRVEKIFRDNFKVEILGEAEKP
jgi:hypothetical protein